ncbi:MAG: TIGR00725 family protein [Proteobacteria bacterium]|nr:TIGR00725 family protein [Pseudomonadota bacterium]MBU4504222.1 TIGR00725 family protein [Pseudomonadota bacterium]MCG2831391.1 TIGR00725 family protein [Desulfobacteraceae bacterium]
MKKPLIIGIMGGGNVAHEDEKIAYRLGSMIAKEGWILLNGGRDAGIMRASAKGAFDHGGLTVGILPDDNCDRVSEYIKIPIITGMGNARNCINVLSSDVVVACPGGLGTLSEIALALKSGKTVILLNFDAGKSFELYNKDLLHYAKTPEEVIEIIGKNFRQS